MPRELSVVGYDDSALMAFTDPPLTTVRQAVQAMASTAVQALMKNRFQTAEVVQSKGGLRMSLRDNGSGHEGAGEAGEGFGLRSLRERAEGLNGSFASTSREDGFTIEAWIPAEGTA